ncbi:Probable siderophore transport system ATP-binding protein YusV [Listeria grayi]|nr:Probable siderophore transport system ATP-binding protein YusV [Listeria grayi]
MDLITFKNISFSRRNNFHMDDISFQITSGKITTLVGPNGSGKSTLLRLLMRLLTPNKGEILLGDKNITAFSAKEYAKKMTMLAQSPEGMIDVVVRDLVSYGRVPHRSF